MLATLERIISEIDEVLTSLDTGSLHARDAASLLDCFIRLERQGAAGRTLVADRAVDAGEWTRAGYRSPEDWLARKSGTGWGQAKNALEASQKLKDLPALDDALRSGKLSPSQLQEIAPAVTTENEQSLIRAAQTESAKQLRQRCTKERARTRSEAEELARYERIHRDRFFRSWTDADGAWRCEGKATADVGARIDAAIAAEAERVFKAAYAEGRREQAGSYKVDALLNLVEGEGAVVDTHVVIRVAEPRLRGEDGVCETDAGPIPVDVAIGEILAGAYVKVLATDGVDVVKVKHAGRKVPAEVKTAIVERDGGRCVRPGCDSSHRLELHHVIDFAKGGPTTYNNLATLCSFDHDLVTYGGHRLDGRPGAWTWVGPP